MLFLVILSILFVVGLLLLFNLVAANMAPRRSKRAAEVKRLAADMNQWVDSLVPLDREELELFSLGQDKQVLRKGVRTEAKGIFTTIYHEPVVAYSYRKYLGKKGDDVLYARTANHEFVFWKHKDKVDLEIDGQEVGTLRPDGILYGRRTGKELARLGQQPVQQYLPVKVGEREVGSLSTKSGTTRGLHDRALEFLKPDLSDKEEQLLLALVVRELVRRTVE